jgi:hypothetical protein
MKTLNHAGILLLIALTLLFPGCSSINEGVVNGSVSITGYVQGVNVSSYKIELSKADGIQNWRTLGVFPLNSTTDDSVRGAILANWDTSQAEDGRYVIRLTATDSNGLNSTDYVYLTVENKAQKAACPAWTCSDLQDGSNSVNINLTKEYYGNNMNCTVRCSCGEGQYALVYSNGNTEESYDYVDYVGVPKDAGDSYDNYNEYYTLSGNWTDQNPMGFESGEDMLIRLSTDYSNAGPQGYLGFDVSGITCTPYCTYVPGRTNEYIAKIRLANATSVTGNGTYSDYSAGILASLEAGRNYTLEVDVRSTAGYDVAGYVAAWIDYDRDQAFESEEDNPGYNWSEEPMPEENNNPTIPSPEYIDLGAQTLNKGVYTFSKEFTVPQGVSNGKAKLRVILKEYDSTIICIGTRDYCDEYYRVSHPGACEQEIYGEMEDYSVDITQGTCTLAGDEPPCGQIDISELVSLIGRWSAGDASLDDVLGLISAWSAQR